MRAEGICLPVTFSLPLWMREQTITVDQMNEECQLRILRATSLSSSCKGALVILSIGLSSLPLYILLLYVNYIAHDHCKV